MEYVRPATPMPQTRPPSVTGVSQLPLEEAFPMNGVTEDLVDSDSDSVAEEIKQPLQSRCSDASSDTEKSVSTEETAEDSDRSPSCSPKQHRSSSKNFSISKRANPNVYLSDEELHENESSELSFVDNSDASGDTSSEGAVDTLGKLTAELAAELETFATIEPVEASVADSVSLTESFPEIELLGSVDESMTDSISLDDGEGAVDYLHFSNNEESANADLLLLDIEDNSTNIADLLDPVKLEFDVKTIEQDYFTAVNSMNAIDDAPLENDSINADLINLSHDESVGDVAALNIHFEFDMDFKEHNASAVNTEEVKADVVEESKIAINGDEMKKTFDQIVNEIEETITKSQKLHSDDSNWIPNGLLAIDRDDSSLQSHNSSCSFSSDDFKEEDVQVNHISPVKAGPMKPGLGCTTITEEYGDDDDSKDPIDVATKREKSKSQKESDEDDAEMLGGKNTTSLNQSSPDVLSTESDLSPSEVEPKLSPSETELKSPPITLTQTPYSMGSAPINSSSTFSSSTRKSALLCKSNPRPKLRKSVSWKEDNDVFTYLPAQAQDLQKARDLVASYERIMAALNAKRLNPSDSQSSLGANDKNTDEEKSHSSNSEADLSEASSSTSTVESLLSAFSQSSLASNESMKVAIQKITEETEKLVSQQFENKEEVKEEARNDILENKWPEIVETTNTSSSSIESLLSALSHASSNSSGSVQLVVQKLKEEAEKMVLFSSQQIEEEKSRILRERGLESFDAPSLSSSTVSSASSMASSTGTSESVKKLMKELNSERSKQAQVFTSTIDMFTLLHKKKQSEEVQVEITDNEWVDANEIGASSSLSTLLSASPCSSQATHDSSESVQYMLKALQLASERQQQRRSKIQRVREFVEKVCCAPSSPI